MRDRRETLSVILRTPVRLARSPRVAELRKFGVRYSTTCSEGGDHGRAGLGCRSSAAL